MPDAAALDRRRQILDAAERCFVAQGFHRTTMQDIAAEAQMSVGNFYRYFPAKDAIVLGLAERDRAEAGCLLQTTQDGAPLWPSLVRLLRGHVVESRREKAVLLVEIWAEVTRNPKIAAMHDRFDRENKRWMVSALRSVATSADTDIPALADLVQAQLRGIVIGRALSPNFDPAVPFDQMIGIVETILSRVPAMTSPMDCSL